MKKGKSFVLEMLAIVLALGFVFVGCDTGTSPGNDDDDSGARVFSVSGSFTKTGVGGGEVKFDLKSDGSAARSVAADSYTVSGVLEDGDLTIRLKGSYDPNTGNWSVSAKSSAIIYTLDGNVNGAGVSQGSSATIAVRSGEEWIPYTFPITEAAVTIPGAVTESEPDGMPSFTQGYWHSNKTYSGGELQSLSVLVSDWHVTGTGTTTTPNGISPFEVNWTVLEFTGTGSTSDPYYIVGCYPQYVETAEDFAKAAADYLGIDPDSITRLTSQPGEPWPSYKWVYCGSGFVWFGGFSMEEHAKLQVFGATGGWRKWAAAHGVSTENKYIKAKLSYSSGNTSFDMINMVKEGDDPGDYTYSFGTLAALKAAEDDLVPEHEWDWSNPADPQDLGVSVTTFTR